MLSRVITGVCLLLWIMSCVVTLTSAEDPYLARALRLMSETPLIDGYVTLCTHLFGVRVSSSGF